MSEPTNSDILAAIEATRTEMQSLRTALMGRMDRLQNGVSAIRETVAANFAASDRTHTLARNVRGEFDALSDEISGLHRLVIRLRADVDGLLGKEGAP